MMRYTKKVAQRHIRPAHFHHGTIHACNNTKNRIRHRNSSALNNRIRDNKAENLNDANKKMFDAGENKLTGILDVIKNPFNKSNKPKENRKKKKKSEKQQTSITESSETSNKKKKKKHGKHYALKMFLLKIVIICMVFGGAYQFVFGITILYGNYMYPAVRDGDLVISYKLQSPIINDIVLYKHDGKIMLGRVVAKENSVIRYDAETETYSVNDVTPSESIFYTTEENPNSDIEYPYTVPSGSIYVLCDHREDYTDSRTYEAISMNDVQGVVVFVIRRRGF